MVSLKKYRWSYEEAVDVGSKIVYNGKIYKKINDDIEKETGIYAEDVYSMFDKGKIEIDSCMDVILYDDNESYGELFKANWISSANVKFGDVVYYRNTLYWKNDHGTYDKLFNIKEGINQLVMCKDYKLIVLKYNLQVSL